MIAEWTLDGKRVFAKVLKANSKTCTVWRPGKPCETCRGHGKLRSPVKRTDPKDARKVMVVGWKVVACHACWGQPAPLNIVQLHIKRDQVTIHDCVPGSFPSPEYWAPAESNA